MNHLSAPLIKDIVSAYFKEDDFHTNLAYISRLPDDPVACSLNFKEDMLVAGMPFFAGAFKYLCPEASLEALEGWEGKEVSKGESAVFELPFAVALTGERIALNLLQRACAVATFTSKFAAKASKANIKILDTRKTTPGHRTLEKYAVHAGGGYNHRFGQTDVWMIKDNHKSFFGGLKEAVEFFGELRSFYHPVVAEIHDLNELEEANSLAIKHVMLDNFTPEEIKKAVRLKLPGQTFEVSGGVNLENLDNYLIDGVDAVSSGSLTYNAPHVDISLKYQRKQR